MIKPRKRPPPTDAPPAIKKPSQTLNDWPPMQFAETSTPSTAIAAGGQNAATDTGATCVRSQAITGQIVQDREVIQFQSETESAIDTVNLWDSKLLIIVHQWLLINIIIIITYQAGYPLALHNSCA